MAGGSDAITALRLVAGVREQDHGERIRRRLSVSFGRGWGVYHLVLTTTHDDGPAGRGGVGQSRES
jgi:hypothetical protein